MQAIRRQFKIRANFRTMQCKQNYSLESNLTYLLLAIMSIGSKAKRIFSPNKNEIS